MEGSKANTLMAEPLLLYGLHITYKPTVCKFDTACHTRNSDS